MHYQVDLIFGVHYNSKPMLITSKKLNLLHHLDTSRIIHSNLMRYQWKSAKANAKDMRKPTKCQILRTWYTYRTHWRKSYVNLYFINYALFLEPYKCHSYLFSIFQWIHMVMKLPNSESVISRTNNWRLKLTFISNISNETIIILIIPQIINEIVNK